MARKEFQTVTVTLKLSPALYATIHRVAVRAGKSLNTTISSLLWIACGKLNLRTPRYPYDK